MIANNDAAILGRLLEPENDDLVPEAAEALLRLDFRRSDAERMNELAERARDGSLSDEERAELDSYNRVGHLLALVHSKARRSLRRSSAC